MPKPNRTTLRLSRHSLQFYLQMFGSEYSGCSYILNALPMAIWETEKSLRHRCVPWNEVCKKYNGAAVLELKGSTLSGVANLSLEAFTPWEIAVLEMFNGRVLLCKIFQSQDCKTITPQLQPLTEQFLKTRFSAVTRGAALLLEQFPLWYDQTVQKVRAVVGDKGMEILALAQQHIAPKQPELAGTSLISAVREQLLLAGKNASVLTVEILEQFSLFERLCLELGQPTYMRETVATGPRVSKLSAAMLADIFGSTSGGLIYLADTFPSFLHATLLDCVGGVFTRAELKQIHCLMANIPVGSGHSAGQAVIRALECTQQPDESLRKKVTGLSLAARICLELWSRMPEQSTNSVQAWMDILAKD